MSMCGLLMESEGERERERVLGESERVKDLITKERIYLKGNEKRRSKKFSNKSYLNNLTIGIREREKVSKCQKERK